MYRKEHIIISIVEIQRDGVCRLMNMFIFFFKISLIYVVHIIIANQSIIIDIPLLTSTSDYIVDNYYYYC